MEKQKMPLQEAMRVAEIVMLDIAPASAMVTIAGSIRRGKEFVSDIELVCIPKPSIQGGYYDLIDEVVTTSILSGGDWSYRLNSNGSKQYGKKNRLLLFGQTAVDIFICSEANYAATLLVRTGSKEHNISIFNSFKHRNWHFDFSDTGKVYDLSNGDIIAHPNSEEEIFALLGKTFKHPKQR